MADRWQNGSHAHRLGSAEDHCPTSGGQNSARGDRSYLHVKAEGMCWNTVGADSIEAVEEGKTSPAGKRAPEGGGC